MSGQLAHEPQRHSAGAGQSSNDSSLWPLPDAVIQHGSHEALPSLERLCLCSGRPDREEQERTLSHLFQSGPGLISSWVVELRVIPSQLELGCDDLINSTSFWCPGPASPRPPGMGMCVLEPTNLTKFLSLYVGWGRDRESMEWYEEDSYCLVWDHLSWKSICLAFLKSWVQSLALHKLCMVTHICSPNTAEVDPGGPRVSYTVRLRPAWATQDTILKKKVLPSYQEEVHRLESVRCLFLVASTGPCFTAAPRLC